MTNGYFTQALNLSLWLVSLCTGFGLVFGIHHVRAAGSLVAPAYSMLDSVVYAGFGRAIWGAALAYIVFACEKGYGGVHCVT